MANLKELRNKIGVIQSTRKVTSAMKLVAGVKLKKAEQRAHSSREYAVALYSILSELRYKHPDISEELFVGREKVSTELLVVFSSDRGLCGNFNYLLSKRICSLISDLHANGKRIAVICVGSKLFETIKSCLHKTDTIELINDFYKEDTIRVNSQNLADKIISYFKSGLVDNVSAVYTRYYSAMKHDIEIKDVIPVRCSPSQDRTETIFEPNIDEVLMKLVSLNIGTQIYQCALDSAASEQSSRMTSMDSATRNADDLLSGLTIKYNRMRQYGITQELVEVISGAKAIED